MTIDVQLPPGACQLGHHRAVHVVPPMYVRTIGCPRKVWPCSYYWATLVKCHRARYCPLFYRDRL